MSVELKSIALAIVITTLAINASANGHEEYNTCVRRCHAAELHCKANCPAANAEYYDACEGLGEACVFQRCDSSSVYKSDGKPIQFNRTILHRKVRRTN